MNHRDRNCVLMKIKEYFAFYGIEKNWDACSKSFKRMQHMNIRKGWVNENQFPKRCSAQSLRIRIILLLLIKARAVVSSCLYRESTQLLISRFMRAHPKVVPSPGRAVSHVLQKHDSSGAGRHTCSVNPKVPPFCVVVGVGVVVVQGGSYLRNPGLTTCPQ